MLPSIGVTSHWVSWATTVTVALSVACTVATGAVVVAAARFIVADHNETQRRNEVRRQAAKLRRRLAAIDDEHAQLVRPVLAQLQSQLQSPTQDATAATTATTATAATKSQAESVAIAANSANSAHHADSTLQTPLSPSLSSSSPSSPAASKSGSTFSLPVSLSATESRALLQRKLAQIDDHAMRLLERIDQIHPSDLAAQHQPAHPTHTSIAVRPTVSALASFMSFFGSSAAQSDDAKHSTLAISDKTKRTIDEAIDSVSRAKKALSKQLHATLEQIDNICAQSGIPSVGLMHSRSL